MTSSALLSIAHLRQSRQNSKANILHFKDIQAETVVLSLELPLRRVRTILYPSLCVCDVIACNRTGEPLAYKPLSVTTFVWHGLMGSYGTAVLRLSHVITHASVSRTKFFV